MSLRFLVSVGVAATVWGCGQSGSSAGSSGHKGSSAHPNEPGAAPDSSGPFAPGAPPEGGLPTLIVRDDSPPKDMPGPMVMMDAGPMMATPVADARPMSPIDSGRAQADMVLRMLSVPPSYTLADETMSYFPKLNEGGDATMQLVDAPPQMTLSNSMLTWTPDAKAAGDHDVQIDAALEGAKLSHRFKVHVGVATKMAEEDLSSSQMGQVAVTAPLSPIVGAAVTVPAGALAQQTAISISQLDRSPAFPNLQGILRPVKLGPSGLGFFKPVTVALPYDKAGVADPSKLAAYVFDEMASRWVSVPVTGVDEENALVMAKASHFSIYAAGASTLDTTLSLLRMSAASTCEGELVGRVHLDAGWDAVEVSSINSRSTFINDVLVPGGASTVQSLLLNASFTGTLRVVSVLDLWAGADPDRVSLGERVLVTSMYVPGDGSAVVRHTDALGNLLGEHSFADYVTTWSAIAPRLAGAATHARFGVHAETELALAARLHLLYAEGDTSKDAVSVDDLGVALVDKRAASPSDPSAAGDGLDVDCDRLIAPYDPTDDSAQPVVVAAPEDVSTIVQGQSLRLMARVDHASGTPSTTWTVSDDAASLSVVSTTERDFSASKPGRYGVTFSAMSGSHHLTTSFAIDVLEPPAINTAPSCTPTASSGLIHLGETVSLSAAVQDGETPDSALSVQWGLIDRSGATPVLQATGGLVAGDTTSAAFQPTAEGTFELGCAASDGSLTGAIGSTLVTVLASNANVPPADLSLTPLAATLVLGDSLTLHASASDRDGDTLSFTWSGSAELGTPTSDATSSAVVFTPSHSGVFTLDLNVTDQHSPPLHTSAEILVVNAPLSATDDDHDGFPAGTGFGTDCDDHNPAVNPAAKEICGNNVDEDCDGVIAHDDCDGDGFTVQQGDCNDDNRFLNPGAPETCDGIDNNCDGRIDDGFETGSPCSVGVGACRAMGVNACSADGAFVTCWAVPSAPAPEVCDGIDNNCDGRVDENGVCNPTCSGGQSYDAQRGACVCPQGQLWSTANQRCATSCPSGEIPAYGSQSCRAVAAGDRCANAIDLGLGGSLSGTLDGRGENLAGCWSSTTSLRIVHVQVEAPGEVFSSLSGNVSVSFFKDTCGGQPVAQCMQAKDLAHAPIPPGSYYMAIGGEGTFSLSFAERDTNRVCSVPDSDGDGVTICDGDCNDHSAAVHPGAGEVCDGIDNDCNGIPDDLAGSCATGLQGSCAQGRLTCASGASACVALYQPGELVELCGDGHDNNCDGQIDESSCTTPTPGQTCALPLDGGYGGTFTGTFSQLEPASVMCAAPGAGHAVIHVDVPTDGIELGFSAPNDVLWTLWQDACNGRSVMQCGKGLWHGPVPAGSYLLELSGQGTYSVSVGQRDSRSGQCLTPDGDGDGVTICNGDCNDADPNIKPGAAEVCDNADNDCNGGVDDLKGSCSTGLAGACSSGQRSCSTSGAPQCTVTVTPGQLPEYCNDGIDNNCNGSVDEAGCAAVALGEVCSLPIDIGNGGSFSGDLTNATDDVTGTCGADKMSSADHVYRVTVPAGVPYVADFQLDGQVMGSIVAGGCGPGYAAQMCFGGNKGGMAGGTSTPRNGPVGTEYWLDAGTYYIVVEGTGPYQLHVSLRNSSSGACITPDGDGDGYALCNGDCNDSDPSVHPGANETCDGIDNDCNGPIDDLKGPCNTGMQGACSAGHPVCATQGLACAPNVTPGQMPEACGDGIDNDCNGQIDEQGCIQLPPGETCALAIDVGQGGSFTGNLASASDDLPSFCGGSPSTAGTPDRVYRMTVLATSSYHVASIWLSGQGVTGTLFNGGCGNQSNMRGCIGGATSGPPAAMTGQWLSPGDYYLVLEGTGDYTLSIGLADDTNHCATPDGDGDGYTLCNGDCDDADATSHPNAAEVCDMRDNDCNGMPDDPHQACSTGRPGACDTGEQSCVLGMLQCKGLVAPGQLPEYCADAIDNNCDGTIDETGCTQAAAGEICSLPIDLGQGGTFAGNLAGAHNDVSGACGNGPHPDHVYRLTVPQGASYNTSLQLEGAVMGSLYSSGCGAGGTLTTCFGSPVGAGPAPAFVDQHFGPGSYSIVIEGEGSYALSVGLRNAGGQCLTPDGDGDGFSLCNGDCDDRNAARHPGVAEICDGLDNDCNGMVDDVHGACNTGLLGACASGSATCSGGGTQCNLTLVPGQLPEYCGDGVDNNCDGRTDEAGCVQMTPGEVCWLPIEVGAGGHFSGDLSQHTQDVTAGCFGPAPDLVFALRVPAAQTWNVSGGILGAGLSLIGSDCAHPQTNGCFGSPPPPATGGPAGGMPPPPPPDGGMPPTGGFDGGVPPPPPPDGGMPPTGGFDGGMPPPPPPPPAGGVPPAGSGTSAGTTFGVTLSEGTYLFLAQGRGHFDLNFVIRDAVSGHCITPDADGDGFDLCQGDCNDGNAAVHPGATETCDGIDNDCNGIVDDAHAACATGQSGACAQGRTACNGTQTECMPMHSPVREICTDGVDNDCNGLTDETGCSARESCADAQDVGQGGTFYGNLDNASNDLPNACSMGGLGDHVYRMTIPTTSGSYGVVSVTGNVNVSLYQDPCGATLVDCFSGNRSFGWSGGNFYVVVKGSGAYTLSLAIQSGPSQCSVPDLDGDGFSICDRDCDEGNASVHMGAAEVCDNIDNDCNGMVDDMHGSCSTGLPGACAQGNASCNGAMPICTPTINPGAQPDYCGDAIDNNCDGLVDEASCTVVQPGEVCSLPIDMGAGGIFSGDLTGYLPNVGSGDCGVGNDVVYKLDVPADGQHMASVRVSSGGAYLSVWNGNCGVGYGNCLLSGGQLSLGGMGGTYYFVVKGSGTYAVSAAVHNLMTNSCSVPDSDGDGFTLCDNDCNDADAATHPGAAELCDGLDNDCNGPIDDLKGSCPTGLPGVCGAGTPYCSAGSVQCNTSITPGQKPDYCNDGLDNNCDGTTDEAGCLAVPAGEVCSLAIPVGSGGTFSGDLTNATDDVSGTCVGPSMPDRIYALDVPQGKNYDMRFQIAGATGTLFSAGCESGAFMQACFQSTTASWRPLSPGNYHLIIEGSSSYTFGLALRDSMTGTCLTPDADGDGITQCDNDCNDQNPSVHPGVPDVCGDHIDNDCDGIIDNGCP